MTRVDKKSLLTKNSVLSLAAMALPAFFGIVLDDAEFPWPMIVPLLLVGPMLASNKMLSRAIGEAADGSAVRTPSLGCMPKS